MIHSHHQHSSWRTHHLPRDSRAQSRMAEALVSHGARTPPSHASTECVRRHAGMAETLILPSVLHVASDRSEHRVSPNADTLPWVVT